MTFGESGSTFMGCDALTATLALGGLGVDALGVNCSLGPELLRPVVEVMLAYAKVPVILQANAGLPVMRDGKPCYDVAPEDYADVAAQLVEQGVGVVGGCCGTTPDFIRAMRARIGSRAPAARTPRTVTACTSGTRTVILDDTITEIGERLNPTNKPDMQEALRGGDWDYLTEEAIDQADAGAQILDVNVAVPGLGEAALMARAVREIQGAVKAPLAIDSADPDVLEAGARAANGKPIINSVTGSAGAMARILPIAKKYGALVIGLTLDESGIPPAAEGRLAVARRIVETAAAHGIPKEDVIIDCLALPESTGQSPLTETLSAIRLIKRELGVRTVLGISNVSHGLPNREVLNSTFLTAAIDAGLDAAIMDPLSKRCREVVSAFRIFGGEDTAH
jgi:5-methyltetrahydrofolate--homocysteine methyltransferase